MRNDVIKAFDAMAASLDENYKASTPDQGYGSLGEWPPDGEHDCIILGVTADTNDFRQKDGQQFPGIRIQFEYRLDVDENHAEPLEFRGAPFDLPINYAQLTDDGARTRATIELNRFAGHVKTLLRRNPTSLRKDMEDLDKLVNSPDKLVGVRLRCQSRKSGERTYRTEYLQQVLDA